MKLKLCKVDNDVVLVLPTDVVSRLDWGPGDECEGEVDGDTLRVVRTEMKHAIAMKIARRGMEKYRDTLEKLAKS
jgi:antitoxin component of MazEF toxin-antitoxin module